MNNIPRSKQRLKFESVVTPFDIGAVLGNIVNVLGNGLRDAVGVYPPVGVQKNLLAGKADAISDFVNWDVWTPQLIQAYSDLASTAATARLIGGDSLTAFWPVIANSNADVKAAEGVVTNITAALWRRRRINVPVTSLLSAAGFSGEQVYPQNGAAARWCATVENPVSTMNDGLIDKTKFGRVLANMALVSAWAGDTQNLISVSPEQMRDFASARGLEIDFSSAPGDPRHKLLSLLIVRIRVAHWMLSVKWTAYKLWAKLMQPYIDSFASMIDEVHPRGAEVSARFIRPAFTTLADAGADSPLVASLVNQDWGAAYVSATIGEGEPVKAVAWPWLQQPVWSDIPLGPYANRTPPLTGPDDRTSPLHSMLPLFRATETMSGLFGSYDIMGAFSGPIDSDVFRLAAAYRHIVASLPADCLPKAIGVGSGLSGIKHTMRLDGPDVAFTDGDRTSCRYVEAALGTRALVPMAGNTFNPPTVQVLVAGFPATGVLPVMPRLPPLAVAYEGYHKFAMPLANWMGEARLSVIQFSDLLDMQRERDAMLPVDTASEANAITVLITPAGGGEATRYYWRHNSEGLPMWTGAEAVNGLYPLTFESPSRPNPEVVSVSEASVYVRQSHADEDPFCDRIAVRYVWGQWYCGLSSGRGAKYPTVYRHTLSRDSRLIGTPDNDASLVDDVAAGSDAIYSVMPEIGVTETALATTPDDNGDLTPPAKPGPASSPT